MTDSVTDTLPSGGTDSAQPSDSSIDNPANWNFADPDEDETSSDTQETPESGTVDESESGEAPEGQETEGEAEEAQQDGEQTEEAIEAKDDVIVPLPSGDKVALGELKKGYLRQNDYSQKMHAVGEQRRQTEAIATRVTQTVNAFADYLAKQLPPAPDPALAFTNPQEHYMQAVAHKQAVDQIEAIMKMGSATSEAASILSEQQRDELARAEKAKLLNLFPEISNPAKHDKFFADATAAAEEVGFSMDEIKGNLDHRMFAAFRYAKIGMEAEKARKAAAQKVAKVPPVQAPRRQAPNAGTQAARDNLTAMRRLAQTGSIHDAAKIDFE